MSRSKPAIVSAVGAMLLFTFSTLINIALAMGYRDLGAFDNAALLFPEPINNNPGLGLGPRLFANGMPPIPALPPSTTNNKLKRQTADQCGANQHSCLEIGPEGAAVCCRNDQYCFLNATWAPQCCGLGTTCGSPCAEDALFCNSTAVRTVTVATSATVTVVAQTSNVAACCGRPCSSSSFLCQAEFGGQCCEYGAQCLSGGQCLFTSTAMSTVVTPIPSGCTTSQFACASSEGGGCCNLGSVCTSAIIGATTSPACAANLTVVDSSSSNTLSSGAKVGIGVGIAIGAAIVIGALTWFFAYHRRQRPGRSRQGTSTTLRGVADDDDDDADDDEVGNGSNLYIRPGGAMSEVTSPSTTMAGGRPRLHDHGRTYDYHGPDAVDGPFTDRADSAGRNPSTEPPRSSPGFAVSERGARPAASYPDRPGDIVHPVELDGRANVHMAELEDKGLDMAASTRTIEDDEHGPFELYGSPGSSPAPMDAEEAERRRTQNLLPTPPLGADQQRKNEKK
ncbi:hypothetical protein GGR53DRAFT_466693 [Hypoxylon sp. FL1150]|nr:hypothetical protein GGR53DRAFT_466693 [Hypoxylon sp. FL1150]